MSPFFFYHTQTTTPKAEIECGEFGVVCFSKFFLEGRNTLFLKTEINIEPNEQPVVIVEGHDLLSKATFGHAVTMTECFLAGTTIKFKLKNSLGVLIWKEQSASLKYVTINKFH